MKWSFGDFFAHEIVQQNGKSVVDSALLLYQYMKCLETDQAKEHPYLQFAMKMMGLYGNTMPDIGMQQFLLDGLI